MANTGLILPTTKAGRFSTYHRAELGSKERRAGGREGKSYRCQENTLKPQC